MPNDIFQRYPDLTLLSITNVSLQDLAPSNFQNAGKLINLLINTGQLTTLKEGVFAGCVQLQSLQVTRQQLSVIDTMAFSGLNKLQNLFLSRNQLTSLNPAILNTLPSLLSFNVDNNLLTSIDPMQFSRNKNLRAVSFNENQLTTLPLDLFQFQTRIESFNANKNFLTSGYTFGSKFVDLTMNRLRNVTLITGEETVHISNNFVRRIICPSSTPTVTRLYAFNNSLSNFMCIRDMVNLTDLHVYNNRLPNPIQSVFLKLTNLRSLFMYDMSRYAKLRVRALAPLKSLFNLRVDQLAIYRNLKATIPKISILALNTRTWNCTYMNRISNLLKQQKITMSFIVSEDRSRCSNK